LISETRPSTAAINTSAICGRNVVPRAAGPSRTVFPKTPDRDRGRRPLIGLIATFHARTIRQTRIDHREDSSDAAANTATILMTDPQQVRLALQMHLRFVKLSESLTKQDSCVLNEGMSLTVGPSAAARLSRTRQLVDNLVGKLFQLSLGLREILSALHVAGDVGSHLPHESSRDSYRAMQGLNSSYLRKMQLELFVEQRRLVAIKFAIEGFGDGTCAGFNGGSKAQGRVAKLLNKNSINLRKPGSVRKLAPPRTFDKYTHGTPAIE